MNKTMIFRLDWKRRGEPRRHVHSALVAYTGEQIGIEGIRDLAMQRLSVMLHGANRIKVILIGVLDAHWAEEGIRCHGPHK